MIDVESSAGDVVEWLPFADELEAVTSPHSRWRRPKRRALEGAGDLLEIGLVREPEPVAGLDGVARAPRPAPPLGGVAEAAMRAVVEGRLDEAERLLTDLLALEALLGSRSGSTARMQRFLLYREQGRLAEILGETENDADQGSAHAPVWRAALALGHAELGMMRQARMGFERLADRDFAGIPVDRSWATTMALLAETCALLGDERSAEILHGLLSPHADRLVAGGWIPHDLGSISRHLALLAHQLGRHDEAIELFEGALVSDDRIGARTWAAWSRYGCAEALLDRDGPGDRQRAMALLDAALGAAAAIGGRRLLERARVLRTSALRGRMPAGEGGASATLHRPAARAKVPEAPGPGVTRNVWRKDGDFWTLGFEGRRIRLKHTNGLVYIRELLQHPAREIHVADLSGLAARGGRRVSRAPLLVERDVGPVLDPEAAAAYRERLRDLQDELDDATTQADLGRAERARREVEIIEHELTAAYGLGGRARRAGDPAERVRKAVTNQIRRALAKVRDAHPGLGRHLQRAIRTGVLCSYTPDLPIAWIF